MTDTSRSSNWRTRPDASRSGSQETIQVLMPSNEPYTPDQRPQPKTETPATLESTVYQPHNSATSWQTTDSSDAAVRQPAPAQYASSSRYPTETFTPTRLGAHNTNFNGGNENSLGTPYTPSRYYGNGRVKDVLLTSDGGLRVLEAEGVIPTGLIEGESSVADGLQDECLPGPFGVQGSISEPITHPDAGGRTEFLRTTPPRIPDGTGMNMGYSVEVHAPGTAPRTPARTPKAVKALFSRSPFMNQTPASPASTQPPLPAHLKRGTLSFAVSPVRALKKQKSMHSLRRQMTDTSRSSNWRTRPDASRSGSQETIQVLMPSNEPYTPDQRPQPTTEAPATLESTVYQPHNSATSWQTTDSSDAAVPQPAPAEYASSSRYPTETFTPTRLRAHNTNINGGNENSLGTPYTPSRYYGNGRVKDVLLTSDGGLRVVREPEKRDTTFSAMMERAGFRKSELDFGSRSRRSDHGVHNPRIQAVPAWILPGYEAPSTLLDPGHNKLGAVASESTICSDIGTATLQAGGNAADAMVATTLCVGGTCRTLSLVYNRDRESAPAAATENMYKNNVNASIHTGLASGVPGELRGLAYLHDNYGSLPWEDLVMPAVQVARNGFPVTEDLVRYETSAVAGIDNFLVNNPTWAIDFAPNGTLLGLGDTITRKRYADTLEAIAKRGPDAFYSGPIAETLINTVQSNGGIMTLADLKNYTVAIRPPSAIDYRDFKITSGSAPSSGTVLASVMKIIEGYPTIGEAATLNLSTHLFDEAIRFAYGQRTELGDPYFVESMTEYQADMLNETTAAAVRAKISPLHTLNVSAYDPSGFESLETPGTSAVVTSDVTGMAISLTTTVNLLFGSQIMVPETGVILNNEMNDFSIPGSSNAFGYIPSPSNYIRPGKRPLSSITPTIVEHANGSLYFAVAAAGGSRIITATLQNLWHVLDQNMTASQALAEPRFHDQLVPNQAVFEYAYDNETVAFMQSRGHNVTWISNVGLSSAQSVRRLSNGTFEAAGEPRQVNSGGFAV
ncbi:hypothetical protein B0A55_06739 [Friedmanniomyces simplex]|uniref:Glutathione hydrolase n=1 Tax=Friedmanniomyces simplex TaxID=329884 RepID=A0A4U0X525_9PEZI|nr:hypothetical protein B0A55_06739 [Friedmanniomyces simplex]